MVELSNEDVRKVASLARLKLSDAEIEHFAQQLGGVLQYVHVLDELDVSDIEPMAHAVDISNVLRDDETTPSLPREDALANAPKTDGRYFLVPQILENA
ncbi:Asp-tRNA(Asn)/Glu-tRNA(Gln) amidotransferase subunit GatC [bacterium]|nr:Asp-tRNA(Asn)/Glu-tRNA(Gln) amidotransferase subunit GatC [bacterium]